ncbi:MAG TPA: prepilin-type N-terminal cleavage/methylation domain-containing protein [Pirellulaceae bacterium]|jgi:general secretion pathway protein G|nr:prepilin-type N-terminal cleavage/methylation domain-containing protein [Pirellulaceae bacterium]
MHRKARRSAFTLVEVLIVVVILAILAAAVVPQFSSSTQDAKVSTSVFNLQTLRAQVQVYKAQHNGIYPDPLSKLTIATSKSGGAPSGNDSYGPYLLEVPECPIVGSEDVATSTATTPAVVAGGAGWVYNSTTGAIWINHADYLTE